MSIEVKMPQLGMNQDSAKIVAWLKKVGDKVTEGEPIFEVETDKATMEVEAQSEGYLSGIQVELANLKPPAPPPPPISPEAPPPPATTK